jgi:serine/threonine protein kinase
MPLTILQGTFWGLYVLLGLSSIAIFVFTVIVARLRREAQKAAIEAQQLGQYQLERKLGTGGMGVVYKGMHAMLRRPTAIKMLDVDKVNDASIQRFEREVQITCQLNHPNTIAIYDYGRTPEGVFYYAMEYLDGMTLQTLVDRYGPLSESRALHILTQICGSLHEAHALGLVHRDIKPANIMLNYRGNEPDVVKVLDFGLVKAVNEAQKSTTVANSLTGTPLYMSPEAIQAPNLVDARSDLYAVGAVGFFLLTGQPVFDAASIVELCQKHITAIPDTPSKRTGRQISEELEATLMACLEKSPFKRPASARELSQRLSRCPAAGKWSVDEADLWWTRHDRGEQEANNFASPAPSTSVLDRTMVGPAEPDE